MCGRYMCNISYDVISDIFFSFTEKCMVYIIIQKSKHLYYSHIYNLKKV